MSKMKFDGLALDGTLNRAVGDDEKLLLLKPNDVHESQRPGSAGSHDVLTS